MNKELKLKTDKDVAAIYYFFYISACNFHESDGSFNQRQPLVFYKIESIINDKKKEIVTQCFVLNPKVSLLVSK